MTRKFEVAGILDEWKKGDIPGNQMVNVILKSYFTNNNGLITLTPLMATDSEIDCEIDSLIKELELARQKAKSSLKLTNEKIRKSIREK